jgi:hypothetical protein
MSKLLAWALTDHFVFASSEPSLAYDPYTRQNNPGAGIPVQGLASGVVETAGQALVVRAGDTARVMRFGEFDEAYSDAASPLHQACMPVAALLCDFHPRTHPVLWRALIAQAHLCACFIAIRDSRRHSHGHRAERGLAAGDACPSGMIEPWTAIDEAGRHKFDWRSASDSVEDSDVLNVPFDVARSYLKSKLPSND